MTEKELQDAIRDTCKYLRLLCYHPYDSRRSEPGFPDLVIVGTYGLIFRELKTETGRLTQPQQLWIERLTAAGVDVDVWRPRDWPTRVLAELRQTAGVRRMVGSP